MTTPRVVFKFWLINFGWWSNRLAYSEEEAKRIAREIGFETRIDMITDDNSQLYASWSPISGWRRY